MIFCDRSSLMATGAMEISKLKALLKNISGLFHLSSRDNLSFEPVQRYYQKVEEMFKVMKLVLDAINDAEIASHESLQEPFASLYDSVDELREIFETWHPLMSKVYFVCSLSLSLSLSLPLSIYLSVCLSVYLSCLTL